MGEGFLDYHQHHLHAPKIHWYSATRRWRFFLLASLVPNKIARRYRSCCPQIPPSYLSSENKRLSCFAAENQRRGQRTWIRLQERGFQVLEPFKLLCFGDKGRHTFNINNMLPSHRQTLHHMTEMNTVHRERQVPSRDRRSLTVCWTRIADELRRTSNIII